jgi:hypothetical protein
MEYISLVVIVQVVTMPPPPMPDRNRAAISIPMFVEKPHNRVPRAVIQTANWFAPRLPIMLHNRPYKGVKVQTASKYDVPSQLASCDLLKSEEMDGSRVATRVVFRDERKVADHRPSKIP